MVIQYLKVLHIVGFVAWFAGLFYLLRMFVYYAEALDKKEPERSILKEQFLLMQQRVYKIITLPALNMTWVFGIAMICFYGWDWFKLSHWLHLKLVLLMGLSWYTYYCGDIIKKIESGATIFSSQKFRMLNEVPTLFLLCIVLLAVLKNLEHFAWTIPAVIVFALALYLGVKWYKKIREAKS